MNKNYYDILQVSRNASPEIIEKAYKTLAKKYHPDLQTEDNKKQAEETLKEINEAYETLFDPEKKKEYDQTLIDHTISEEDFNRLYQENQILKNKIAQMQHTEQNVNHNFAQQSNIANHTVHQSSPSYDYNTYEQELQNARKKAYYDAYIQDLKNRGYKIRYKKSLKDYIKDFIAIICTIFILFLLWHIPFIHDFFISLFQENKIISTLLT